LLLKLLVLVLQLLLGLLLVLSWHLWQCLHPWLLLLLLLLWLCRNGRSYCSHLRGIC
jgi:hypothetical protein